MKRIIYTSMIMQKLGEAAYSLSELTNSSYTGKVHFPIISRISEDLEKDDELSVCIVRMEAGLTEGGEKLHKDNEEAFKKELDIVNESIGAKISYKIIATPFSETKDVFGKRFLDMYNEIESDCKVYADITYGTKTTALLIMNILNFAERFYNADIESIVYGKILFKDDKDGIPRPDLSSAEVCDVTMLYLLNNLTNSLDVSNGEEAKNVLKVFFGN